MKTKEQKRGHDATYYAAYRAAHIEEIRAHDAAYYQAHKEERLAYQAAHREERRERDVKRQRWFKGNLQILRAAQGCGDCGTSDGPLLHHHVDPSTKKYGVARMDQLSLRMFLDEIAKCKVLCWSCHSKHHSVLMAAGSIG